MNGFKELPRKLKTLIIVLPVLPVVVWAISFNDAGTWVPFAITAILLTPILWWVHPLQVLRLPLILTMAVAILYGPASCVLTAACYAVVAEGVLWLRWKAFVPGVALVIYDALLYSLIYSWIGGWKGVLLMGIVSFLVELVSFRKETKMLMGAAYLGFAWAAAFVASEMRYPIGILSFAALLSVMWCLVMRRGAGKAPRPSNAPYSAL